MMKSFCLCFFAAVAMFAAATDMPAEFRADPARVIAAASRETAQRHPDADYVYLDDRIHTRFEADGSSVMWDDEWVKVLTEKGRRACAGVSLDFNERYGDVKVLCVEIVGTNGVTRTIDFAQTLKEATDNSSLSANIVDPKDKQLTFTVPGLTVGEIRHVRFCRRTRRARMKDTWCDVNALEYAQPIASTTISVDVPAGRPLACAVVRNAFSNTVTRLSDVTTPDGYTRVAWKAQDVPQLFPEPDMPALSRCAQTLRLSTIKDWPTVSRWYWNLCVPHLEKTTAAMTNEVASLTRDCADDKAKVRALFKFVSQKVRYMGLTLEDDAPGYEPHDVKITFENRYGVCRDKAALLVALLRIAGIEAYPVLIHAGTKMDAEVPMPYFNHAIVAIKHPASGMEPTGWQLADPTDESAKDLLPAYLCDKSYLVATPEGEVLRTSPVTSSGVNMLKVDSEGTLDENGDALLTTTFAFDGINDTVVRKALLKKTPQGRRTWFESVWRKVSAGAELLSLDIQPEDLHDTDKRLTAKTVVRLPEILLHGKTCDTLSLPFATVGLSVVNNLFDDNMSLETRRFPLVLPCTAATDETIRIKNSELRIKNADSVNVTCTSGRTQPFRQAASCTSGRAQPSTRTRNEELGTRNNFLFTRTVNCTNGVLTARREMRVNDIEFDADAYESLRNVRKEVETAERVQPIFEAHDENADVHLRIRKDCVTYHYVSPTEYVITNEVEREVLTDRGRQLASEFKCSYVPSVGSVELVSATVSNRNGKVHAVTPREINVLDGSWNASAPRYPAAKYLVANFPGVEIGSVISYVYARAVTNAPVADSFSTVFGGRHLTDYEQLEIHMPRDLDFRYAAKNFSNGVFRVTTNENEFVYKWMMSNVPRLPEERALPPSGRWRPCVTASLTDWPSYGKSLVSALAKMRDGEEVIVPGGETPQEIITEVRKLMRKVRTAGPGLHNVSFDSAFTPVGRVWREGYGSYADRMNLMYAMLEAAGFDCAFVLVANDSNGFRGNEKQWRMLGRVETFGAIAIKAVWSEGWIPFMRDESVFWLCGENEFTPPEAGSRFGDSYYDPQEDAFGRINATAQKWVSREEASCRMEVRENGAVDFIVTNRLYGSGVGSFRKKFTELLPEMRSRFHRKLLGDLAQNATATSDLVTDVEGYPFSLSFDAYAEDYAVVTDEMITLKIPAFTGKIFPVDTGRRKSPIYLAGKDEETEEYEIVFPKGYTQIEAMPESFEIANPLNPGETWLRHEVTHKITDDRLTVTIRRREVRESAVQLSPAYNSFLHDWNRRAASEAGRTISVRER